MGMPNLTLRLSEDDHSLWTEEARSRGMNVTGFLKILVEEAAEKRTSRGLASAVARDLPPYLVPELAPLLARELVLELGPLLAKPQSAAPTVPLEPVIPTPFDRSCFDADFHRSNTICATCGGSYHA